jgi:hypothetical protein
MKQANALSTICWVGLLASVGTTVAQAQNAPRVYEGSAGGPRLLEEGMPAAMLRAESTLVRRLQLRRPPVAT